MLLVHLVSPDPHTEPQEEDTRRFDHTMCGEQLENFGKQIPQS